MKPRWLHHLVNNINKCPQRVTTDWDQFVIAKACSSIVQLPLVNPEPITCLLMHPLNWDGEHGIWHMWVQCHLWQYLTFTLFPPVVVSVEFRLKTDSQGVGFKWGDDASPSGSVIDDRAARISMETDACLLANMDTYVNVDGMWLPNANKMAVLGQFKCLGW